MTHTLRRTLGLRDLTLIVIGTTIGSGIFIVPAVVLRQTGGSLGLAVVVWLAAGILSLLGALTYGELGAAKPDAGGLYVYIRDAFGPLPAFLYGWTAFFVIASGSCATLAVAFAGYAGQFVPLSPIAEKLIALAMIAAVAAVNVRGTRTGADVQNWTTGIKVAGILLLSAALLWKGSGATALAGSVWPARISGSLLSSAGIAMIGVLWAYEGWQYATFAAGETRDPQRIFPRAIVAGTAALIAIYVLAVIAYAVALGPERAAASPRIAASAAGAVLGERAARLVAAVILVSMFSAANGIVLTAPRLYFAMARDGAFFRRLADVHPRYGTPALAIVAGALWSAVLALSGTFEQLLTYVVFTGWIFYALGALSLFVDRRRRPDAVRAFRTPGYPVTPLLFVGAAAAIIINAVVTEPRQVLVGLIVVLLGTPAFYWWRASARRHRQDLIEPSGAPPGE